MNNLKEVGETAELVSNVIPKIEKASNTSLIFFLKILKLIKKEPKICIGILIGIILTLAFFWMNSHTSSKSIINDSVTNQINDNKINYSDLEREINKCLEDEDCQSNFNKEYGLGYLEKIVYFLDLQHSGKPLIEKDIEHFEKILPFVEKDILNKHNFYYKEQPALTEPNNLSSVKQETEEIQKLSSITNQPSLVAIEFADNNVYREGIAASCVNGKFYEKRVELKNPNNLENNTVVNIKYPIDCSSMNQKVKCEGDTIIHIPFSEAIKLYPDSYNPKQNINKLPSCSVASVEIVE